MIRILDIEITDDNRYHKDKKPKYVCSVEAEILGAGITIKDFKFEADVVNQIADSFEFHLRDRLCKCDGHTPFTQQKE